ncbi:hypothetical protein Syn8016DRAFT_1665 [Synechococcus sp. WH 8016]|nr:hypothetical protein Syn8016DRAFT_1665 [Synechococcus sp. WH 8016]
MVDSIILAISQMHSVRLHTMYFDFQGLKESRTSLNTVDALSFEH